MKAGAADESSQQHRARQYFLIRMKSTGEHQNCTGGTLFRLELHGSKQRTRGGGGLHIREFVTVSCAEHQ